MVSTNLDLLQSNLSYMIKKHGVKYHWLLDLFTHLKLPIFDGMKEGLEKPTGIECIDWLSKRQKEPKSKE